jgi:hypothetical protein
MFSLLLIFPSVEFIIWNVIKFSVTEKMYIRIFNALCYTTFLKCHSIVNSYPVFV